MKTKLTLLHLPQCMHREPPIGIAYLKSFLQKHGFETRVRDLSVELKNTLPDEHKHLMDLSHTALWMDEKSFDEKVLPFTKVHLENWANEIANSESKYVGFSVLTSNLYPSLYFAKRVRELCPEKIIIFGGPESKNRILDPPLPSHDFIDYMIVGEGEEALLELLQVLEQGRTPHEVKGLHWCENGVLKENGKRPLIHSLDALPFPSFSDFDLGMYEDVMLPVLGSRGCIFKCTFCSEAPYWERYRFRSGKSIFEEMKSHSLNYGVNNFNIVDSLINGNFTELESLCERLIEYDSDIQFHGKVSIRPQMTPEVLSKMKRAGCEHLFYGLESGSAKVIADMKKGFLPAIAERVLKNTHESGILTSVFMMIGYPTETNDHFNETLEFIDKNHQYLEVIMLAPEVGIAPGSPLHANQSELGIQWKSDGWHSEHSTPEIRQHRYTKAKAAFESLNLVVY